MMDAITDPLNEQTTLCTSSQVGKSQIIKNVVGYFIDQDPSPILMLQPTLEMARSFSKERLMPMLRDTPCLQGKVRDARSKDSSNEILHKTFPGGHVTLAGANSAASLSSRPIRVLLCDEPDRYPASAGAEGDPVKLAVKRTRTFWNRRLVYASTPTTEGVSRIESLYAASDQRHFYVPCPRCGTFQILIFSDRSTFADLAKGQLRFDPENASWAHYECGECQAELGEADKYRMIASGEWRALHPEHVGHAGFHISELYSTFSTWKEIAADFLEAKKRRETLRVWINTTLGETFEEEEAYTISDEMLEARVESYTTLPSGVTVLTAAVDVQDDRLEALILGWGIGEESWLVHRRAIYGSPDKPATWDDLDIYLAQEWRHYSGAALSVSCVFVDSGGHFTQDVYRYTRKRQGRRYYAIKGYAGKSRPLIGKPTRNNKERALVIPLGVDDAKRTIYDRLEQVEPGPGYMHFNQEASGDFFQQLTAEKQVVVYSKGFPTKIWKLKHENQPNEVLDQYVYNLGALRFLNPNIVVLKKRLELKAAEAVPAPESPGSASSAKETKEPRRPSIARTRRSWMNRW